MNESLSNSTYTLASYVLRWDLGINPSIFGTYPAGIESGTVACEAVTMTLSHSGGLSTRILNWSYYMGRMRDFRNLFNLAWVKPWKTSSLGRPKQELGANIKFFLTGVCAD